MLSASERRRLLGALALLRSRIAGERDAATAAALRVLDAAQTDWPAIILETQPGPRHDPRSDVDWRALAAALLRSHIGRFDDVEIGFLRNVPRFASLSPKQLGWLRRLAERAGLTPKTRRGARAA